MYIRAVEGTFEFQNMSGKKFIGAKWKLRIGRKKLNMLAVCLANMQRILRLFE